MNDERRAGHTEQVEPTVRPWPRSTDDLEPAAAPVLGDIPWTYGETRVTAMPVDPARLFVYWELSDEAIVQARSLLAAPDAGCALRVYDTTYRLFDGTNANWHLDVAVHRPANNHYVHVGRPGATLHVDIGVLGGDGRFMPIVRSAPVDMPRDSVSTDTRTDWMTVTPEASAAPRYAHRFTPKPAALGESLGSTIAADEITRALAGEGWSPGELIEMPAGGRTVWTRWVGRLPGVHRRWSEHGAFGRVEIVFEGERTIVVAEGGERVVFGPWRVTIRGIDPLGGHRIIDRWDVFYSWRTDAGAVRTETAQILRRISGRYRTGVVPAGSEARLVGESWASEALQAGASEWSWLRASEGRLAGASEVVRAGASELSLGGASERVLSGASEARFAGGSGWLFGGASERELLFGGASELKGASEPLLRQTPQRREATA